MTAFLPTWLSRVRRHRGELARDPDGDSLRGTAIAAGPPGFTQPIAVGVEVQARAARRHRAAAAAGS